MGGEGSMQCREGTFVTGIVRSQMVATVLERLLCERG